MKKLLSATLVIIFASAVGWYFMPPGWRGKISGAARVALRGDQQEIKKYFNEVVLPQDPEKRRTVLLGELKKSFAEIKKGGADNLINQNFIDKAGEIVKDLEEANHDKTFSREVAERVVNRVFPVKNEVSACRN